MKRWWLGGFCILLVGSIGCGQSQTPAAKAPPANPVIGNMSWVITDEKSHKEIGKGSKQITLSDVTVKPATSFTGGSAFQKDVPLSNHFFLELIENGTSGGFGFAAKRDDMLTICWEWFVIDKPGHAKKLQETGELGFKTANTANGKEMVQSDFTTDISMRVVQMRTDGHISDIRRPDWRVKILKGSTMRWPSLVNGKVVAN